MNFEFFIAKRLNNKKENKDNISRPIITVAIAGITLGIAVMILSIAIVTGFKKEIKEKVFGLGAHIQILNFDSNRSYETIPIDKELGYYPFISTLKGVKNMQVFATKGGIIKTKDEIQGVVCKGVGSKYDWSFFRQYMVKGTTFNINDSNTSNKVIISKYLSDLLKLDTGQKFRIYFIDSRNRVRARPFIVNGIYETSLDEIDKYFVLCDIKHIQKINNWEENYITGYEIILDDYNNIDEMTTEIRNLIGYDFFENGTKLKVISIKEKYPQIFDWLSLLDINVWVILILMVLVAGFNMISGLLILILERTHMIGIFKSLGAENFKIKNVFLYLSFFIVGKGMLWGNIIGIAICFIQSKFNLLKLDPASYYIDTVPINLQLHYLILLNIGTLIVTLLILLLPAIVVSRISPVKTIRFE